MKQEAIIEILEVFNLKLGWKVIDFALDNDIDGQIKLNTNQEEIHLVYEIKKSITPSSIPPLKQNLEKLDIKSLNVQGKIVFANYISTKAREILRQEKINYADTGGNIFIAYKAIYIHIETGHSDRSALNKDAGRAFTKAGLKVLYQFFRSENRSALYDNIVSEPKEGQKADINSPYKNISTQASVSKDTVSKVVRDLLEQGYILRKNSKEFIWSKRKAVFERWVSRVNEILRPSLNYKKYRFINEPIAIENLPLGYQLGGYHGADRLFSLSPSQKVINAPYLIYSHRKNYNEIIKDLGVIPDKNGNVTVVDSFWKDDSHISPSADFPVLYADLVSENDPRLLEIAQLIYTRIDAEF